MGTHEHHEFPVGKRLTTQISTPDTALSLLVSPLWYHQTMSCHQRMLVDLTACPVSQEKLRRVPDCPEGNQQGEPTMMRYNQK